MINSLKIFIIIFVTNDFCFASKLDFPHEIDVLQLGGNFYHSRNGNDKSCQKDIQDILETKDQSNVSQNDKFSNCMRSSWSSSMPERLKYYKAKLNLHKLKMEIFMIEAEQGSKSSTRKDLSDELIKLQEVYDQEFKSLKDLNQKIQSERLKEDLILKSSENNFVSIVKKKSEGLQQNVMNLLSNETILSRFKSCVSKFIPTNISKINNQMNSETQELASFSLTYGFIFGEIPGYGFHPSYPKFFDQLGLMSAGEREDILHVLGWCVSSNIAASDLEKVLSVSFRNYTDAVQLISTNQAIIRQQNKDIIEDVKSIMNVSFQGEFFNEPISRKIMFSLGKNTDKCNLNITHFNPFDFTTMLERRDCHVKFQQDRGVDLNDYLDVINDYVDMFDVDWDTNLSTQLSEFERCMNVNKLNKKNIYKLRLFSLIAEFLYQPDMLGNDCSNYALTKLISDLQHYLHKKMGFRASESRDVMSKILSQTNLFGELRSCGHIDKCNMSLIVPILNSNRQSLLLKPLCQSNVIQ